MRKSFEVERLQLQVAVRDRRIKELEDYIENVAKAKPPPAKTYETVIMPHKFRTDATKAL
jgi:hypothetical protein